MIKIIQYIPEIQVPIQGCLSLVWIPIRVSTRLGFSLARKTITRVEASDAGKHICNKLLAYYILSIVPRTLLSCICALYRSMQQGNVQPRVKVPASDE